MHIKDFITNLDQSTAAILHTTKSCTLDQLHFKKEENWTILEVLEHLYLTDKVIFNLISKPSDEWSSTDEIIGNEKLKNLLVDKRTEQNITAPDFLTPKNEINDLNTFEKMYVNQREALKNNIIKGTIVVDHRIHKHPILKEMTISDWLNFTIHHTHRHLEQIKSLISNANS